MDLLPLLSLCLLTVCGTTDGVVVVKVKEGSDVILPCSPSNRNLLSERFEWKKNEKFVFLYESAVLPGVVDQFRGRVSHFEDELKNGNASITIRDTREEDSGTYSCEFTTDPKKTFYIELVVGVIQPIIITHSETLYGVPLQCEVLASPGFRLNISWFDGSGTKLTDTEINTEGDQHYSLFTTVMKSGDYHCVATMEEIHHQVSDETYVTVPGLSWLQIGLLISGAVMVLVGAATFVSSVKSSSGQRIVGATGLFVEAGRLFIKYVRLGMRNLFNKENESSSGQRIVRALKYGAVALIIVGELLIIGTVFYIGIERPSRLWIGVVALIAGALAGLLPLIVIYIRNRKKEEEVRRRNLTMIPPDL